MNPDSLLICFMLGIGTKIPTELTMYHSTSLAKANGLARLVKDKIHESRSKFSKSYPPSP